MVNTICVLFVLLISVNRSVKVIVAQRVCFDMGF